MAGNPLLFPVFRPMAAPPLPLHLPPWRLRPRWRLRRPLHPPVHLPCRFPLVPLLLFSVLFRTPLPPLRSRSPPMNPNPLSLLCYTWRFHLHSPPVLSCPRVTSPLHRRYVFCPAVPMFPPPLPLSVDAVLSVASVVPLIAPTWPRFAPCPSLDLPPAPLPPPLLSPGLLCPPALTLALPNPAPATSISRKDKVVSNRTGECEAR